MSFNAFLNTLPPLELWEEFCTEESAAVVVAVTHDSDGPQVLLTRRSRAMKKHPGQIAFPGGRWEPSDKSLLETALREAREEVALDSGAVNIVGSLTPRMSRFGLKVYPFVGTISSNVSLQPEYSEVDEIFFVPVDVFLSQKPNRYDLLERAGEDESAPAWLYEGYEIWGLTAMILHELVIRYKDYSVENNNEYSS